MLSSVYNLFSSKTTTSNDVLYDVKSELPSGVYITRYALVPVFKILEDKNDARAQWTSPTTFIVEKQPFVKAMKNGWRKDATYKLTARKLRSYGITSTSKSGEATSIFNCSNVPDFRQCQSIEKIRNIQTKKKKKTNAQSSTQKKRPRDTIDDVQVISQTKRARILSPDTCDVLLANDHKMYILKLNLNASLIWFRTYCYAKAGISIDSQFEYYHAVADSWISIVDECDIKDIVNIATKKQDSLVKIRVCDRNQ
mmetsp:Transcript_27038/g.30158  ORF Transcript_27038/g.30158 Transcript_27038/m.30158 type:complete len:254 (+) Transcript_27038:30-791(+)